MYARSGVASQFSFVVQSDAKVHNPSCARLWQDLNREKVLKKLHNVGIIGILRLARAEGCIEAMDALAAGGLNAFEVTATTPGAIEVIAEASRRFRGRGLVGIGTVLDAKGAVKGINAGAQFVVSPSLQRDVIRVCKELGVVSCPGTLTATEVVQAWKWGADLMKVFPAAQVGPEYIKALLGPLPWARLVPTGGVDARNAADFIRAGAYCLGVGGALTPETAISQGRWDLITQTANKIVSEVAKARKERG